MLLNTLVKISVKHSTDGQAMDFESESLCASSYLETSKGLELFVSMLSGDEHLAIGLGFQNVLGGKTKRCRH